MEPVITKRDRYDIELKSRLFRELEELVELCPQYTIPEIMYTIMFWKSGHRDPYFMENEQFLKKMEQMRQSIENDYVSEDYE